MVRKALIMAALALAACQKPPPEQTQPPPAQEPLLSRVKVLQADVLVVDGRHIRLADAYAPQPIPDARCWAEALAAKQATDAVRQLVRAGADIQIKPTGQRDDYNREIAHVLIDRIDLSQTLHEQGLAAQPHSGAFGWCDPISKNGAGAPDLRSLMDFSGG